MTEIRFNAVYKPNDNIDHTIIEEINEKIKKLLLKHNIESNGYETMTINSKKYAITKCDKCGVDMINRDKNPLGIEMECFFEFLHNGGTVNENELCEMCLPKNHRWS